MACQALIPTATLASVHDANEQNFIAALAGSSAPGTVNAWIGLWDQSGSGLWRWTDNSPVEYAYWEPKQPDNYLGRQHCVRIQLDKYGQWDDIECDNGAIFVSVCQTYAQNFR
ncbi:C-type lectin protein [Aphelenchoides avenae]|nr:C-type lectin protein [Aphelenchus avenae]